MDDIKRAGFRPNPENGPRVFMGIDMTREERASRRVFCRNVLRGTRWDKLSNEQLDAIRLIRCGDSWMIEDPDMYQYMVR